MSKKLYVGNLPYSVDDTQLQDIVSPFGEILSAQVIKDKFSGRSKGFGFVEMANDEEAQKAIEALDGKDFGGRPLKVNEARPMTPRVGGSRNSFAGGRHEGSGRDFRSSNPRW